MKGYLCTFDITGIQASPPVDFGSPWRPKRIGGEDPKMSSFLQVNFPLPCWLLGQPGGRIRRRSATRSTRDRHGGIRCRPAVKCGSKALCFRRSKTTSVQKLKSKCLDTPGPGTSGSSRTCFATSEYDSD